MCNKIHHACYHFISPSFIFHQLSMLFLLLSAVESPVISAPPPVLHRQHMQHIAMFALLTQRHYLSSMIENHVCTWVGVTCVDATVTEICWIAPLQRSGPRIMDIRWIPQSVTAIILSEQKAVRPFEARALPRGLQICRICSCGVCGTIDMHGLPRDMKDFIVKYNQISGKISLLNLPLDLRALELKGNKITAIYGRQCCLPVAVHKFSVWPIENNIEAKYIAVDGSPKDARIQLKR